MAISKIAFGILVALALIVAFACEQKESVELEPVTEQSMKIILLDDKLKIEGIPEDIEKLKGMFSENSGFEIKIDSLGNTFLMKNEIFRPKSLNVDEQIFFIVEEMPEFPGGELALRKYIANAVDYPEVAQENGIQGKVYVTFVVSKDGYVADAKIARGVNPSLDAEALRVVNSLPKWIPGKQRGEYVNVSYTVPINFVLQ